MKFNIRKWFMDKEFYEVLTKFESASSDSNLKETSAISTKLKNESRIIFDIVSPGTISIGNDVCSDLELIKTYSGVELGPGTIFHILNNLCLKGSESFFKHILTNPLHEHDILDARQQTIASLGKVYETNQSTVDSLFDNMRMYEDDIDWIYGSTEEEVSTLHDMVYFNYWHLKFLNNQDTVLSGYNLYRMIVSPVLGIVQPIVYCILPFIILRVKLKIKVSFVSFIKLMMTTLMSGGVADMLPMGSNLKYISLAFTIIFYFQGLFNSIELSRAIYKISKLLTNKMNNVIKFVQNAKKVIEMFWKDDLIKPFFSTSYLYDHGASNVNFFDNFQPKPFSIISNFGKQLKEYKRFNPILYKHVLNRVYIVDTLLNIYKLKQNGQYSFVKFETSDAPKLVMNGMYHPSISIDRVVRNDMQLGSDQSVNHVILTGPNAGGKSTLMKAVMLSAILSQTLTIAPCNECMITPFYYIDTQINIPDCKGRESLFEAEMNRSYDKLKNIAEVEQQGKRALLVIDELFNSTNPVEGIAGSYAVAQNIGNHASCLSIISTHYVYLAKLAKRYKSTFKNMKMSVNVSPEGDIKYPYRLLNGVSQQYIALELLKQKGFDTDIVKNALNIKAQILSFRPQTQSVEVDKAHKESDDQASMNNETSSDE